jgi:DNA modification methylase
MSELDDGTVNLIITDPPFNVGFSCYGGLVDDRRSPQEYALWVREWVQECLRVLVPGGQLYALMPVKSMPWWLGEIRDLWDAHRGHYLTWCKTMANLHQEATFIRAHEPVLWLTKGGRPNVFHREFKFPEDADWFTGSSAVGEVEAQPFRKAHPTPRPTWLVEKFVLLASDPGMLVLDPMLGSGTTAWVSRRLLRRCVGYDINAEYLKLARRWLAQSAGEPGGLLGDGTGG